VARSLGVTYLIMGTPSERRGLARLGASPERSLLMRLLRGLPGVDVRIVADPALRRTAAGEEKSPQAAGVDGGDGERVDADASSRTG
jgi:hypothetical protein